MVMIGYGFQPYPRMKMFVEDLLPTVFHAGTRIDHFLNHAHDADRATLREALTQSDTPPVINIHLLGKNAEGLNIRGQFNADWDNNAVYISTPIALEYERHHTEQGIKLLIESTLLHEIFHWIDYLENNYLANERGAERFYASAYTEDEQKSILYAAINAFSAVDEEFPTAEQPATPPPAPGSSKADRPNRRPPTSGPIAPRIPRTPNRDGARRLNGLNTDFREKVEIVLARCRDAGVTMVPHSMIRDPWDQARLWRKTRTTARVRSEIRALRQNGAPFLARVLEEVGPQPSGGARDHVTNAVPGVSWHQWGEAVDCYWEVNGDAEWATTRTINGVNGYRVFAQTGRSVGLEAGGFWRRFKDWGHLQLRSASSPLSAGYSWAEIDAAMEERFGRPRADEPREMAGTVEGPSAPGAVDLVLAHRTGHGGHLYRTTDRQGILFRARMTICADGAPRAYHPDGSPPGLDSLDNAGRPGNWWALETDAQGIPKIQAHSDPAPGFYISMTALGDWTVPAGSQRRYVDAAAIPYVVLPHDRRIVDEVNPASFENGGPLLRLGDFAVVCNPENGRSAFAICADIGPADELGEGSIALAQSLGLDSDPRRGGTHRRSILYLCFPRSGNRRPRDPDTIVRQGQALLDDWGGIQRLVEVGTLLE